MSYGRVRSRKATRVFFKRLQIFNRARSCEVNKMRAIDADALIDDLKHDVAMDQDSLDYEKLTDSNRENIQFDKDCKQNAIDLLQHAPTIEPQRKKGKWIEYDNSHCECPFCHEEWSYFDNEVEYFNYCPNCGADMREDGDANVDANT